LLNCKVKGKKAIPPTIRVKPAEHNSIATMAFKNLQLNDDKTKLSHNHVFGDPLPYAELWDTISDNNYDKGGERPTFFETASCCKGVQNGILF
jgi:hypothetical protein